MIKVINLDTEKEDYYMNEVGIRNAIKTSYAFEYNMASNVATQYDELMESLDHLIQDGKYFITIGSWTTRKSERNDQQC